MSSTTTSLIAFACIFGGSLIGIGLRGVLSERHFTSETRDVLRLILALLTTMTALVLGLLVSTAKSTYDARRAELTEIASNAILADRSLALYGSDTDGARKALHDLIATLVDQIQSNTTSKPLVSSNEVATDFYRLVRKLAPRDDAQRLLKAEALRISLSVAQIRAAAVAQESTSVPPPLVVILVSWLTILFAGFGIFASRNLTVLTALCIAAITVSSALFLILDMDRPSSGFMRVSTEPLRNAISVIGK